MVSVKGTASRLEKEILNGIIEPNCPNIEFKNITFDCKSIKDAAGHIFINQTYYNVAPVRYGEWIHPREYGLNLPEHYCSECRAWEYSDVESKFCPNCGAKMDKDNEQ